MLIVTGFLLFWNKRISRATICKIYNNRIEFDCKFWIIDKHRVIKFKDFGDIVGKQEFLQKRFNIGDILIYTKRPNLLTTGIEVKNVPNFKETFAKTREIIGEKTDKEV